MSDELKRLIEHGPEFGSDHYWAYNLPLQAWVCEDGSVRIVNYMPRKEQCTNCDEPIPDGQRKKFFDTAADKLENLAKLMRLFADRKINCVYYHDEDLDKAVAEFEKKQESKR